MLAETPCTVRIPPEILKLINTTQNHAIQQTKGVTYIILLWHTYKIEGKGYANL
jgi:hypothetical protein